MDLIRVLRTARVTLSQTFTVDGVPTAPSGTLECAMRRLDGTHIAGSPFTYTVNGTTCSFSFPGLAVLDALTADWSGTVAGANVVVRDIVEIVGGFLFNLSTAQTLLKLDPIKYPLSTLMALRTEVETTAEEIAGGVAFVPRFKRVRVTGSGHTALALPSPLIRAVRAVSIDGVAWSGDQLAGIDVSDSGVIYAEGGIFTEPLTRGRPNVIVEYEHGMDLPPSEIPRQAMMHARNLVGGFDSGMPQNAVSFSAADGGFYRLATPGQKSTGLPTVDAAYLRYAMDMGGFA